MKTVLGVFTEQVDAEEAIKRLHEDGFQPEDISIIMRDRTTDANIDRETNGRTEDTGSSVAGSTVAGATTGVALGALAGLVASIAIPGLGAFFIGGPLAAALGLTGAAAVTASGAATGALAGGLIGGLTGLGLSESEARSYEKHVNEGAILVAVPAAHGSEKRVEEILADYNANDIRSFDLKENNRRDVRFGRGLHQ